MLRYLEVKPKYSIFRRIIFPIFNINQLISILPIAFLSLLAAVLAEDIHLFFTLFLVGYLSIVLSMRMYIPYQVIIPVENIDITEKFLNSMSNLEKTDDLTWERKLSLPILKSSLDRIALKRIAEGYCVTGRKMELVALVKEITGLR